MRKAAVLLISATAAMLVTGVLITQSLVVLQRVAAVEGAQGIVQVRQRGHEDYAPLAGRERVAAGDMIRTGANSHLDLYWVDGTRMRIGPNARVRVLKTQYNAASRADTAMFKLDLGRVWIRVLKVLSHKSKFEVITPTATAGVRGTIFSVEVKPGGKTLVSVKEGKVAVHSGARQTEVPAGDMSEGGAPEEVNAGERALWQDNDAIAGPHLQVKQPAAGANVARGQAIQVSGVAEPGASLTVNDQPQALKLRKTFSTTVPAPSHPGPFRITVQARDRRQIVSTRTITVNVTP